MRKSLALAAVVAVGFLATSCGELVSAGSWRQPGQSKTGWRQRWCPAPSSTAPHPRRSRNGLWFDSLQMISATTGWALLSTSNPSDNSAVQLGRTTDGGRTWTLVTPPAPRAALDGGIVVLRAIDARRAWLVAASPDNAGGMTVVFRTVDAGRSWQRSAPINANQPVGIDIVGQRAWLLESLGAAMGSNPVRVYRTTDGGLSWSLLAQSQASRTRPPPVARESLPLSCDKVGIAVRLGPDGVDRGLVQRRLLDIRLARRRRTLGAPAAADPAIGVRAGRLRSLGAAVRRTHHVPVCRRLSGQGAPIRQLQMPGAAGGQ